MRVPPRQYAELLYELTGVEGLSRSEQDKAVSDFVALLRRNHHTRYVGRIVVAFREIWNDRNGLVDVEVVSSQKLNDSIVDRVTRSVGVMTNHLPRVVEKVSPSLGGGVVLRVGDQRKDESISGRRKRLEKHLGISSIS